jgi:protein TonB
MVGAGVCEAAQKEVPRSVQHKRFKSGHSNAAKPYGADLSESESLRALEVEMSRKLGSKIRESDYPEEARRQGWSGTALVAVLVGSDGKIEETSIYRTIGFPMLDQQALRMVDRVKIWWIPQRLRKREVKVTVPVGFYLRDA